MPQQPQTGTFDGLSIGDVAKICEIPVHTIRYWEHEFAQYLQPSRTIGKQRRYTDSDIQDILRIKQLLWAQRFSIKVAKRILSADRTGNATTTIAAPHVSLDAPKLTMRLMQVTGGNLAMVESVG